MNVSKRLSLILFFILIISICLCACEKKKEGRVAVTETEYSLESDGNYTFSLNAKGKVKNIGEVDVKKVVVTGYCKSCDEMMISGKWFATQEVKTADQKDMISYLAAGAEEEFSFKDIAYYYTKKGETPVENPQKLEIVIDSFEVVE